MVLEFNDRKSFLGFLIRFCIVFNFWSIIIASNDAFVVPVYFTFYLKLIAKFNTIEIL